MQFGTCLVRFTRIAVTYLGLVCSVTMFGSAQEGAIDCEKPPKSATWDLILPCVEGRPTKLVLVNGKTLSGKVRLLKGEVCLPNQPCRLQVRGNFFSRKEVDFAEIVFVKYRPHPTAKKTLIGWAVGLGTVVASTALLFRDQCDEGNPCWILGLPLTGSVGFAAGYYSGRANAVEVNIVRPRI